MRLTGIWNEHRLKNILNLYEEAFPEEEKKPFSLILQKKDEGDAEILSVENDKNEFLGLAITANHQDMVLLDYFAIAPEHRSSGIGSKVFQMLKQRYEGKRFFLEIERTDIYAENIEQRKKRKAFYLKNGMKNAPFLVNLLGVEMEIMAHDCDLCFDEYFNLYHNLFGKDISSHISLLEK